MPEPPSLTALTDRVASLVRRHYGGFAEGDDAGVRILLTAVKHELYCEWLRHKQAVVTIKKGEAS